MADALLSIALEKLTQVLGQQLSLFAGATRELEKLRDTFQAIQALLADAETRQATEESVNLWLSRLRAVAYDIDDLLDDWVVSGLEGEYEAKRDHDDGRNKMRMSHTRLLIDGENKQVRDCLLSPYTGLDHVASRYKIARRISEIRERLDQIDNEKNGYGLSSSSGYGQGQLISKRPYTGSLIEEEMIGRDQDKVEIINKLVSGSSNEDGQVRVTAIVGIGGQGKTTLAREIYNDKSLRLHFDLFSWACVTEIFDGTKVIKAILDDLKVNTTAHELSPLQKELRDKLEGKRFLVILDDVWNEEEEKWNTVRASLTSGVAGSRILVTTRTRKVANIMDAICIHELQGLSDDDSWRLFSCKAFAGRNDKDRSDLQAIGRQIVGKCKGVPLSIKVMGSAMNCKRSIQDWQNILESTMWSLPEAKSKILPALWLSYYNLPLPLKQCFAYCSIYEKDTVMDKDELVKLWVLQGFVHAQGNREVEDIAAEYFDDLVAWSMFQEAKSDGSRCKVHDLLHDLAEFITKDETYVYMGDKSNQCHAQVRHASLRLSENNPSINSVSSCGAKTLRTLFVHDVDKIDTSLDYLFQQARFLRALVFRYPNIKKLPRTIRKLKHLRYLDLSCSWIVELPDIIKKIKYLKYLDLNNSELLEVPNVIGKLKQLAYLDLSNLPMVELPESVCYLHNLRTLKLNDCYKLKKLPRGMVGMVGLRHLEIQWTNRLEYLPQGMGRMTSLKTLSKFIVGGEGGCEVNELQQLNYLQGSLVVQNLYKVSSAREACKAELRNKPNLRRLVLEMSSYGISDDDDAATSGRDDAEIERMDGVLEGLRPHENLEELELHCNRRNSKFPSWLEGLSFTKLTKLEIQGFVIRCEQNNLPGLGKLPALKYLSLGNIDLKKVGHELYYGNNSTDVFAGGIKSVFPELEQLIFTDMPKLEEWELMSEPNRDIIIMPRLSILELKNCAKLIGLPNHLANAPLTNLEISGCQRLKWTEYSSYFSLLEKISLNSSSEFFSSGLPHLPKLKELLMQEIKTLPNEGWEHLLVLRQLQIHSCYELKSLPDGLTQLQSLENLEIYRCCKIESLPEGLGQLKKLQSLKLNDLQLLTYLPNSLGQLESLEHLHVLDSKKLESLPEGLGQFKILKSLKISNAEELACLPNSIAELELLEELDISGLKKLESLPEGLEQFKKLKSLKIRDVEMLTCLPNTLGQLKSLEKLYINCPKNLQSLPQELGQLKKLKSLTIKGAEELTCLPDSLWQLESLEDFEINGLAKLESLPHSLVQLKKLENLTIENMEGLANLPQSLEQLQSLKTLNISQCGKLKSLPHRLGQLVSLKIDHLQALTCLPDKLVEFKLLKGLSIGGWKELKSLPRWLVQLKALEDLAISHCTALRSLPRWLKDLPLLRHLSITNCPLLSKRYKKEGDDNWSKILQIPEIYIDDEQI